MNMAMTATAITEARPLPLDAQLEALGIPVLPRAEVGAHKRTMVQESRIGLYKLVGPLMYLLSSIFLPSLMLNNEWLKRYAAAGASTFVACVIMAFVAPVFGLPALPFVAAAGSIAGAVILLVSYIVLFAIVEARHPLFLPSDTPFMKAASVWMRMQVMAFDADSLTRYRIPAHLHARARAASSLSGARVYVESFGLDPFLVLTLTDGVVTRTRYIAAWDTGNPHFDNA